jgi:hypothetical protein
MPLHKIYVSKSLADASLEVQEDFGSYILMSEPCDSDFIKLTSPSLVKRDKLYLLHNPSISEDLIVSSIRNKNVEFVIVFSKLDKRSKLYKKLNSLCSIEFCGELKTYKDKKQFTITQLEKLGIPSKYYYQLLKNCDSSPARIKREIFKLSHAIKVLQDPTDCLCLEENSYDLFNFLDALLEQDLSKCLYHYFKIESSYDKYHLSNLICNYIGAHLCLLGKDNDTSHFWKVSSWQVNEWKSRANKMGFSRLVNLYNTVTNDLHDFTNPKDPCLKLRKIIFHTCLR